MTELKGAERAAVFLMSLGDEAAATVLRHIGAREVQQLSAAMARLRKVSWDEVNGAISQFNEEVQHETAYGLKAPEFTRRVLTSTVGDDRAKALMDRIGADNQRQALESLQWMQPRELAELLADENPQVLASVLVLLDPVTAADLMSRLEPEQSREALLRVARLKEISPSAVAALEQLFQGQVTPGPAPAGPAIELRGPNQAAEILNNLDVELEQGLMDSLRDADDELASEVEDLMFVFENLKELDDRGFQRLLREIPNDLLIPALKGADAALQNRFFENMSRRAAGMLQDDLDVAGPIKLSEVEQAQKEILSIATRLSDEGAIALGSKGGEEYV